MRVKAPISIFPSEESPCLKYRLEILSYDNHLGLRIGQRRYQMTRSGPKSTNFLRWLRRRLRDFPTPIHGIILDVPRSQIDRVACFFEQLDRRQYRYHVICRNCSQVTCEALRTAGIPAPHWTVSWLPGRAYAWFSQNSPIARLRIYHPQGSP